MKRAELLEMWLGHRPRTHSAAAQGASFLTVRFCGRIVFPLPCKDNFDVDEFVAAQEAIAELHSFSPPRRLRQTVRRASAIPSRAFQVCIKLGK